MPQSSVTHLRAVGGAIQALENFGAAMFLDTAGNTLQHWIRVILSLMNSIALSVRSIAVDFVISLFGSVFDMLGNIDELVMIFASVLPEVVAREAALCSVSGFISNLSDVEKSVWPIRRAFADIEDANRPKKRAVKKEKSVRTIGKRQKALNDKVAKITSDLGIQKSVQSTGATIDSISLISQQIGNMTDQMMVSDWAEGDRIQYYENQAQIRHHQATLPLCASSYVTPLHG